MVTIIRIFHCLPPLASARCLYIVPGGSSSVSVERKHSSNALGPVPGFYMLYLTESFDSLILTDSTRFADKGIVKKPKVTEVLVPKWTSRSGMLQKLYSQAALCNGVKTKHNKTNKNDHQASY